MTGEFANGGEVKVWKAYMMYEATKGEPASCFNPPQGRFFDQENQCAAVAAHATKRIDTDQQKERIVRAMPRGGTASNRGIDQCLSCEYLVSVPWTGYSDGFCV